MTDRPCWGHLRGLRDRASCPSRLCTRCFGFPQWRFLGHLRQSTASSERHPRAKTDPLDIPPHLHFADDLEFFVSLRSLVYKGLSGTKALFSKCYRYLALGIPLYITEPCLAGLISNSKAGRYADGLEEGPPQIVRVERRSNGLTVSNAERKHGNSIVI